jgi:hypothetical protein
MAPSAFAFISQFARTAFIVTDRGVDVLSRSMSALAVVVNSEIEPEGSAGTCRLRGTDLDHLVSRLPDDWKQGTTNQPDAQLS